MARKKEDKKEHKKPWQETYATMEEIERFVDDRVALRYIVIQRSGDEIKARLQMLEGLFPIGQVTGDG